MGGWGIPRRLDLFIWRIFQRSGKVKVCASEEQGGGEKREHEGKQRNDGVLIYYFLWG
jgi:hypothetical protein